MGTSHGPAPVCMRAALFGCWVRQCCIMCNRHMALVWEDAAADGGYVPVGPLNGTELLILLKMATMVFFPCFMHFISIKKNLSSQGDAYQHILWQRKPLPFIISKHFLSDPVRLCECSV